MARAVQRLTGLDASLLQVLQGRGFQTSTDILETPLVALIERLDLSSEMAVQLLKVVASQSMPKPTTAFQLHKACAAHERHLQTNIRHLDQTLGGGIACGSLTELVGPAGVGKSQLCMMLTISALMAPLTASPPVAASALYIDTERKFSPGRLSQIAAARWPHSFQGSAAQQELTSRIIVLSPSSSADLLKRLKALETAVVEHNVKLVIIDSIAVLARADYGRSIQDRQAQLGQQAASLKRIAESFQIPVVVTNQVTSQGPAAEVAFTGGAQAQGQRPGDAQLGAALGTLWAHAVNTRLILELAGDSRFIKIAKSPAAPTASFPYRITAAGLELASQEQGQEIWETTGNVLAQGIRHDVDYQPPR